MTKYEKDLLNRFHELYLEEGAIDGFFTWNDCCDYDEDNMPTWFLFTNSTNDLSICGNFDNGIYQVECCLGVLKTFKTLRGAMRYVRNW